MSSAWPLVALGEILKLDLDRVPIDASATYEMVGIYSFGRGLFDREPVSGNNTSYKQFYRLAADHVVMSQLFGWEGALATSSDDFAGKYVSPQFPTFRVISELLDRNFLGWCIRQPSFWKDLGSRTKGMGDRRRTLNPEALFATQIPLPPLSEQQRIVARIEELSAKIEEARGLRRQSMEEAEDFIISLHKSLSGSRIKKLGDILCLDEDAIPIKPTDSYLQVGVRGFGAGLFAKPATSGMDTTYKAFNRLYEGALVMSQVKAWEGAVAVCGKSLAGYFVSPEYRTFRFVASEAIPSYFAAIVKTEWFWSRLKDATRGVGARRERTRPEQFLNIEIPVPTVIQQRESAILFDKIEALKSLQAETAAELDALLPSILDKAFKGDFERISQVD